MIRKFAILCVLLLWVTAASAQQQPPPAFSVYKTTVLSGAAEVVTVQKPTTEKKQLRFYGGSVHCTVSCVVTLEVRGTAATTTALAPSALTGVSATATAYHTSNVGTGRVVGTYPVNANDSVVLDLSKILLGGGASTENLTIRTDSITGTVRIIIVWEERE